MKIVELKEVMEARFAQVDARLAQVDVRFDALETRLAADHEDTRRHMEMLVEQLKAEYRLGFDKMLATDQHLAFSNATNAREHATFAAVLDDHEARIKVLESPSTPTRPRPPTPR
jgi:hypothetical protein